MPKRKKASTKEKLQNQIIKQRKLTDAPDVSPSLPLLSSRETTSAILSTAIELPSTLPNELSATHPLESEISSSTSTTPLIPTSAITPQILVPYSGITRDKKFMVGIPYEIYTGFDYTFNHNVKVWRSYDCQLDLVVKGQGEVNRCHACHLKHHNYQRDLRNCQRAVKAAGVASKEKTISEYTKIIHDEIEDAMTASADEQFVLLKEIFIANRKAGPFKIKNKWIGPCAGFEVDTKKAKKLTNG